MRSSFSFVMGCLALVLAVISGCSSPDSNSPSSSPTPVELLNSDLADLHAREHSGLTTFDQTSGGAITQIFGGTRSADLVAYLDARLHAYFDPADPTAEMTPSSLFNQNFLRQATPPPPTNGKVGAANMGIMLWIAGQVANTPVTFSLQGRSIPVDSPRAGIMMIGEGYESATQTAKGQTIALPPEFRQAILLHEARHSDCTGGLSTADLNALRSAQNDDDTDKLVATMHCGHLHVKCPAGHDFAGIAACDHESWGAYTVGEYYYRGVREDAGISSLNRAIADAVIVDYAGRTLVPRTGQPDMTSTGLR